MKYAAEEIVNSRLYPDPECVSLTERIADYYNVRKEQVLVTNGSDEVLYLYSPDFHRGKDAALPQYHVRFLQSLC